MELKDEVPCQRSRRQFYSNIGLWPRQPGDINPTGWLDNFGTARDREIAAALLESFVYLNSAHVEKMVSSAFHSLSTTFRSALPPSESVVNRWQTFRRNVVVTYPTGDIYDPAGSGHIFIRSARGNLVTNPGQLRDPAAIGDYVTHNQGQGAIDLVFVDDLAATGTQFLQVWFREISDGQSDAATSLASLQADGRIGEVYYTPAICTAYAKREIAMQCPTVMVRPAHLLPDEYFANPEYSETNLVPANLRAELPDFLARYAHPAGYKIEDKFGFGDMGLALAFEHGVPDNTLPIFTSENSGWTTLRRKR
ncbi:phosphoribosyltransferase-like protein [Rhodococcus sp. IEGM1428]|uniref:phosphoribosyltransferase-like protein n=1 Tax=Rhodococcus sp. IEGM1428 TaxID=3392191 RepID=UPI003D11EC33